MGVIKKIEASKKEEKKKNLFENARFKVNIQPDLILHKEKAGKQLFVYKAYNVNEDKSLPVHQREIFIVSEKRVTEQEIAAKDYTIESKEKGHFDFPTIKSNLKHLGWMTADEVQARKERQMAAEKEAHRKAVKRQKLRDQGKLDAKGFHRDLLKFKR